MSDVRKITRMEAVRDQLDSAYKVYFLWDDLVSAVTLAGAAERVMSDMQAQDGIFGVDAYSIRSIVNLYIKPEYQKDAAKLWRADYDFFRHADRKSQSDYDLKEKVVEFWLFVPLCSFEHLKQGKTQTMRAYALWFFIKNPNWIKDDGGQYAQIVKQMGEATTYMSKKQFYELFCSATQQSAMG